MEAASAAITRTEIEARLRDPSFSIVDVLPRESFVAGHLPGAISLPLAELPARARRALPAPDREIAVYCAAAT